VEIFGVALHEKEIFEPIQPEVCLVLKVAPPPDSFSKLNIWLHYSCGFDLTYICEQIFSTMNLLKYKYRALLTDGHLKKLILLGPSQTDYNIRN
jgi:hypothetical protein